MCCAGGVLCWACAVGRCGSGFTCTQTWHILLSLRHLLLPHAQLQMHLQSKPLCNYTQAASISSHNTSAHTPALPSHVPPSTKHPPQNKMQLLSAQHQHSITLSRHTISRRHACSIASPATKLCSRSAATHESSTTPHDLACVRTAAALYSPQLVSKQAYRSAQTCQAAPDANVAVLESLQGRSLAVCRAPRCHPLSRNPTNCAHPSSTLLCLCSSEHTLPNTQSTYAGALCLLQPTSHRSRLRRTCTRGTNWASNSRCSWASCTTSWTTHKSTWWDSSGTSSRRSNIHATGAEAPA